MVIKINIALHRNRQLHKLSDNQAVSNVRNMGIDVIQKIPNEHN